MINYDIDPIRPSEISLRHELEAMDDAALRRRIRIYRSQYRAMLSDSMRSRYARRHALAMALLRSRS